jgi:hypothetical protein
MPSIQRTHHARAVAAPRPKEQAAVTKPAPEKKVTGQISIGGKTLARLAKAPTPPSKISQKLVDFFFDSSLSPLGAAFGLPDLVSLPVKSTNWRSASYASTAMAAPLAVSTKTPPLGDLTIMRPGLGNIGFSPAQVFRTAQYSGKVVVAYTGLGTGAQRTLRPAKEIEGVPVPKSLQGKVFVIGNPEHNLINYLQSSDVLLEQMQAIHEAKSVLGTDVLTSQATIIGHSQGGLDAALTRKRLDEAGLGSAIGRLVAVGSPFKGSNCSDRLLGLVGGTFAAALDSDDGFQAVRQLEPEATKKWFGKAEEKLVDLSYSGAISGTPEIKPRLGIPPFEIDDPNNIRPILRLAADAARLSDATAGLDSVLGYLTHEPEGSDGLVPVESASYGKKQVALKMPYDHIGLIEDYHVIDRIAADAAH